MKALFIISYFALVGCVNQRVEVDPIPTHDTFEFTSIQLDEVRVVNVWKPHSYETENLNYPVLYMADGGVNEDFPHIANTLHKLISEDKIPPIILVGIENTERGRDLTGFSESKYDAQFCPQTDGAKKFRHFITHELMNKINQEYRTTDSNGLIGESLSGLFVMETFLHHPESFDFYIAFDPSLWWNNHYLVKNAPELLKNHPIHNIKLWFAGSSAEDISEHTILLAKTLKDYGPVNLTWQYSNEPTEKHNTIFRSKKEEALIWTLNE